MDYITEKLLQLRDEKYKIFSSSLIPNINKDTVLGVRIPLIRKLAKEIGNEPQTVEFLNDLPHKYLEENILHGILICNIKDTDKCICELDKFLPFTDNWAVCDSMRPECFKKDSEKVIHAIDKWMISDYTYEVRFAIEMLMMHFLDEKFKEEYLQRVSVIKSQEYYINMMIAWYFATALAKQWKTAVPYIENCILPLWVHNKTIQKAIESYRITPAQKEYLKGLKIK